MRFHRIPDPLLDPRHEQTPVRQVPVRPSAYRLPGEDEPERYAGALEGGSTEQLVFDSILQLPEFGAKNAILGGV
jgi:hypothetical protein